MELCFDLCHLSTWRPQLPSQVRSAPGTGSVQPNPSLCLQQNGTEQHKHHFTGLTYLPRMMQVTSHKGRPAGSLVLLMGSITEHVADDLDRCRRSLGTRTPHCCYAVAECHQASLVWRDFQPLAHPTCNCLLCSLRKGREAAEAC